VSQDRFNPFDRVPPQNLEAEQAVLGSMLIERPAVERAAEILKPEDFYRDAHRHIFETMLTLAERDEAIDLITVEDELRSRSLIESVGGFTYLRNLMDAPATAANIEYYARLVEEKAILRRLLSAGTEIQGMAYAEFDSVNEVIDRAEQVVFDIGKKRMGQFFYHLRPLLDEELDRIEKRYENKGITTGRQTPFDDLNFKTSGLQPSDLIIVAARPSMGKTSLSVQLAQHIALVEKLPVAIFSLEMSKEQLVTRMICSESRVDASKLRNGHLLSDDWQRVGEGISRLAEAPIYIDDSPDISAMEMRTKCRRLKSEQGDLGVIMIDYLQLMRSHKRTENRNQEISEIARACKGLARELKVPVIALSQLSRAVESRPDKRPMLSDLRECVIGDTLLTDALTGRQLPIRNVRPGNVVLGMGKNQKIGAYTVHDVWSTDVKPVFTLTTRTGRTITASANHPFLTAQGWKRLEKLQSGDVLATAMPLPFHDLAESDLLWEPIVSIEPAGEQETFDIRMECGNFLANGIIAHNSGAIEAEADIVMFIYREAYYKQKEAVTAGEEMERQQQEPGRENLEVAELIIAKQRNGPTGAVKVAFLPQYTRFENLAREYYDDDPGE
jgi:replicative DNA helicase